MPSTCNFELDRPNAVYFSGETITGRIHLITTKDKTVKGVYIHIHGEGKVRFPDNDDEYLYEEETTYLDNRTVVFSGSELQAGTYSYSIKIELPLLCPTSCKAKFGKIRYGLSLVVQRALKYNNVFTQPIVVIKTLDLNKLPNCVDSHKVESSKNLGVWPFNSGTMQFLFVIPRGGYVSGQGINYTLYVTSDSPKDRSINCRIRIKQIYTFTAHKPCKKSISRENVLTEKRLMVQCLAKDKMKVEEVLLIPPAPPTLEGNYIISVAYKLKLDIDLGFGISKIKFAVPIVLGTVPLSVAEPNKKVQPAHSANATEFVPSYGDCVSTNESAFMSVYNHFPAEVLDAEWLKEDGLDSMFSHDNDGQDGGHCGASSDFRGGGDGSGGGCDIGGGSYNDGGCDDGGGGDSGGCDASGD